jgi:diguanylate cyclase (GGDEF)-like protein/putative nucleotidyltransferase with HDIG domain
MERETLSLRARVLLIVVCGSGLAIIGWAAMNVHTDSEGWLTFALLGTAAALAHLFPVRVRSHNTFSMAPAFLVPAVFLLPLPLLALLPIVMILPSEAFRDRYRWYIVAFNISNWTLDLFAAYAVQKLIREVVEGNAGFALAGVCAAATTIFLNHLLLALVLTAARGHTIRSTRLLSLEGLSNEGILGIVGVAVAAFWMTNRWLVVVALAPLALIQRSLTVESLKEEARVDPKTGLFNARYFANSLSEELARAIRFQRPLSVLMADLDLLRDINNNYGHLAGDAVLHGIAEVFRAELRHFDVPARFGGEEFSIVLPETPLEEAVEIAERIRRAVAERQFEVETSEQPIRATVSIGVATFPKDGIDANELIHQADLAVYRAKLQGRNRVLSASAEPMLAPDRPQRLASVPPEEEPAPLLSITDAREAVDEERPREPRPRPMHEPRLLALTNRVGLVVGAVALVGLTAGVVGLIFGNSTDWVALVSLVALVGVGQALALEYENDGGSISASAVGALAGAAIVGPRAALILAATIALVEWSARRQSVEEVAFNIGLLTLASLSAALIFSFQPHFHGDAHRMVLAVCGLVAGIAYYLVNTGLVSLAIAVQGHESWPRVFRERFAWLLLHYIGYGFIAAVMAVAYEVTHIFGLAVFAVPLLLMRNTQEAYLKHTQKSAQKLRRAAETIKSQNVSLEQANRLLRERSTAAMESLSATVDARDSYTAGHSRRVQQLALAMGRELGLSQAELDLLGHAALFHDIGKLAIPDAILLKPTMLTEDEWVLMQRHSDEGARIIDRLGFLQDAVPAIRHHHECFDGTGYPDGLKGEEIPLGARIIHVADALDSMLTTRIYRAARPAHEALEELRRHAGSQFCPRCVRALEQVLPLEGLPGLGIAPIGPPAETTPLVGLAS